jgi:hypothetical protein
MKTTVINYVNNRRNWTVDIASLRGLSVLKPLTLKFPVNQKLLKCVKT